MADTIKTAGTLKFDLAFNDGDTRTVTLKNPKLGLTLEELNTVMSAHGTIFAGDKDSGVYNGFTNARRVATTTRQFDLG